MWSSNKGETSVNPPAVATDMGAAEFKSVVFGGYRKSDVDNYVDTLQKTIISTQQTVIAAENTNETLKAQVKEAADHYKTLWEKNKGQSELLERQNMTLSSYEEAILEQAALVEKYRAEIDEANALIEQLKTEKEALQEEREAFQEEKEALLEEHELIGKVLEEQQEQLDAFEEKFVELKEDNKALAKLLQEKANEVEELKNKAEKLTQKRESRYAELMRKVRH